MVSAWTGVPLSGAGHVPPLAPWNSTENQKQLWAAAAETLCWLNTLPAALDPVVGH